MPTSPFVGSDRPHATIARHGCVAVIKMDAGPVNAVSPRTMVDVCAALASARDDPTVKAVVLGHAGKHFVAGADYDFLASLKTATAQQIWQDVYRHFQGFIRMLYSYPKPTVAAIGGAAFTVGCEAALACDFRVVTESAVFEESWIRLGMMPPLGGLKMLPALIGYGKAADMILRARRVGGVEAVHIGLAHMLAPADELEVRAIGLASELADAPPLAYQAARTGMRRALENSLEDTLAASANQQALLILSDDFREGVDAAMAKRKPVFKGQ